MVKRPADNWMNLLLIKKNRIIKYAKYKSMSINEKRITLGSLLHAMYVLRYYSPVMEMNIQENRQENMDYSEIDHSTITRLI